ncbi:hypothetical protein JTE90_025850 [Oedothorax gibbosus]|uniref:NADH dehydrogenase subunit 6 n=1 Tax=Oedothorax gibbosus TaxID=931172 RepID=A0AAV6UL08_9ARAC|nr:hypothetical protein JTE90_025850 [Oedothorax gibbosus]
MNTTIVNATKAAAGAVTVRSRIVCSVFFLLYLRKKVKKKVKGITTQFVVIIIGLRDMTAFTFGLVSYDFMVCSACVVVVLLLTLFLLMICLLSVALNENRAARL